MTIKEQTMPHVKKKHGVTTSWINSTRKSVKVSQEKRKYPRVDCDCPSIITGYSGNVRVTDFSFGGCFVECESGFSSKLGIGKVINLAVKFPTENQVLDFKVKVIRAGKRGMACKFVELKQQKIDALERFFDFVKEIQPLF